MQRPFPWTPKSKQAAILVAHDDITDVEIAGRVGVHPITVEKWKRHAEFRERVDEEVERLKAAVRGVGIRNKENRLAELDDLFRRGRQVIEERARQHVEIDDLEASPAAGASSGLMVLTVRYLPGGGRVEEWAVDTGLLKELRETMKQSAQEMGQWTEKSEQTTKLTGQLTSQSKVAHDFDHDAYFTLFARLTGIPIDGSPSDSDESAG